MSTPPESPRRWRRASRWLLRIGALALLFLACNTGGVAATTLFPSGADTLNYGADLRLSLNPGDISAIQSPTIFGDIRMDFGGPVPAPGIVAQVHVKERITDLLARPNISVQSLQPGPLELERAARGARDRPRLAVRRGCPRSSPSSASVGMPRGGGAGPGCGGARWSPRCGSPRASRRSA